MMSFSNERVVNKTISCFEDINPIQYGGGGYYGPPIVFPQYLWNDLS